MIYHIEHWNTTGRAISIDVSGPRVIANFIREYFPGSWAYNVERYRDHLTGRFAVHICIADSDGHRATFFVETFETEEERALINKERDLNLTPADVCRFWSKVEKGSDRECWLWTGQRNGVKQYGKIIIRGKWYGAHRLSWMLHTQEDPGDLFVCHKCDTPLCVNPHHLFLGTAADNMRDCASKGRLRGGKRKQTARAGA